MEPYSLVHKRTCPVCDRHYHDAAISTCPLDGSHLTEETSNSLIGTVVAQRYQVISLIAEGAWGCVYQARHLTLNKLVALKMLHSHLVGDCDKVKRFEQEAQVLCAIDHRNIASVHDFGSQESGQPFFVMDYFNGISLQTLIKQMKKLPPERGADIFGQICAGLVAAHEKGIIHRDIKPSNIFIAKTPGREDLVKILDFGLAKLQSDDENAGNHLTQTGETLGTPEYMSPEQCGGGKLDARSDIYSLGCLMYETLTGTQPFTGQTPFECMTKHVNALPPPMARINAQCRVPAKLENIIFRALEKDPRNRFQTAQELQEALNAIEKTGSTGISVPGESFQRQVRQIRQSAQTRWREIVGATLMIALIVGALGAVNYHYRKTAPEDMAPVDRWRYFFNKAHQEMNSGLYAEADKDLASALALADTFATLDSSALCLQNQALLYHLIGDAQRESKSDATIERIKNPVHPDSPIAATDKMAYLAMLLSQLRQQPPKLDNQQFAVIADQINDLCNDLGADKTEAALEETEKLTKASIGENNSAYSNTLMYLASARLARKDHRSALRLLLRCSELRKNLFRHTHPGYTQTVACVGAEYAQLGNLPKAEKYLQEAVDLESQSQQVPVRTRVKTLANLIDVLDEQKRFSQEYTDWKRVLQLWNAIKDHSRTDFAILQMVYTGRMIDGGSVVEKDLTSECEALKKQFGSREEGVSTYLLALTEQYRIQNKFPQAEAAAMECVSIRQEEQSPQNIPLRRALDLLGRVYIAEHQYDKAIPLFKMQLATAERAKIHKGRLDLDPLIKLAYCSMKFGKQSDASDYMKRYRGIVGNMVSGPGDTDCTQGIDEIFTALRGMGMSRDELAHMAWLITKQKRVEERDDGEFLNLPCPESLDALSRIAAINGDWKLAADSEAAALTKLPVMRVNPFVVGRIYQQYAMALNQLGQSAESTTATIESGKYPHEVI